MPHLLHARSQGQSRPAWWSTEGCAGGFSRVAHCTEAQSAASLQAQCNYPKYDSRNWLTRRRQCRLLATAGMGPATTGTGLREGVQARGAWRHGHPQKGMLCKFNLMRWAAADTCRRIQAARAAYTQLQLVQKGHTATYTCPGRQSKMRSNLRDNVFAGAGGPPCMQINVCKAL